MSTEKPKTVSSTDHPPFGLWRPHYLKGMHYGADCVEKYLLGCLPTPDSKAFIITGRSLADKTPLVKQLEKLLGENHHAGTFSDIKQHAPVAELDKATDLVGKDDKIDTIISLGGGSPIDSSKAISHRLHEKSGKFLTHIAIPTTLSAAECTQLAGFTGEDGVKTSVSGPELVPSYIFYDPTFAKHTPKKLWIATGVRALDHAIESLYHPSATEVPCKAMALYAVSKLFELLPKANSGAHPDDQDVTTSLQLASFASLGFMGLNLQGGLGLSHALGYALGSPYGIPHGETSCMTLGHVVKLKAKASKEDAAQLARVLPYLGKTASGDAQKDGEAVGNAILELVSSLGLHETLTDRKVGKDQLPIITKRATGGKTEGEMYDAVSKLVEKLY